MILSKEQQLKWDVSYDPVLRMVDNKTGERFTPAVTVLLNLLINNEGKYLTLQYICEELWELENMPPKLMEFNVRTLDVYLVKARRVIFTPRGYLITRKFGEGLILHKL